MIYILIFLIIVQIIFMGIEINIYYKSLKKMKKFTRNNK